MATRRLSVVPVLVALMLASATLVVDAVGTPTPAEAVPVEEPGGFTAVTPGRILDTRTGLGAPASKLAPGQAIDLQVTGRGGVPATGVSAVALNVAVTAPTAAGYLTLYPTGQLRPLAANSTFVAGQTVSTGAMVKVGTSGKITIFNSSGSTHVIVDVNGWHATTRATGDPFTPMTPARLFDSRSGAPLGAGGTFTVPVTKLLPAGVKAVALNVTVTTPTAMTYLTVYPAGEALPLAASLNVSPGQTRGNFVAVKVVNGSVNIYNAAGTTHVVVDLLGYWSPASGGRMVPITPTRVMDTRFGLNSLLAPILSGQNSLLRLAGAATVPVGAAAAVLNVTATVPTSTSYLTLYPVGAARPLASNLNFSVGETVPNLVIVPLSASGEISIFNAFGSVDVVVDIVGWLESGVQEVPGPSLSIWGANVVIDPTSTYAYITNTEGNQVEVLRLADGTFEDPIFVGSEPMGLDLTPSGDRLYVANRGSSFVSVVDVAARTELHRFPLPSGFVADRPFSIAVLANGKALMTTTFYGSGFGARMYEIDLATEAVKFRSDFWYSGTTTEYTTIRASGDRSAAVITAGNISSGPVFRYSAVTDTFTPETDTSTYTDDIATNRDGTVTLLTGGQVFDAQLRLAGTVRGCGSRGVAVNAAGTVGYGMTTTGSHGSGAGAIVVCDLVRFQITGSYEFSAGAVGRLAISPNGRYLVGITDDGVVIVRP